MRGTLPTLPDRGGPGRTGAGRTIRTGADVDPLVTVTDSFSRLANLRKWNTGVGFLHLAQAVAILAISTSFAIPVAATVQTGPPGAAGSLSQRGDVFEVRFAWAVALFLLLAAGDHLLMVAPRVRSWYEANLLKGVNYARWAEYSVSASVMVVLIGLLCGINDLYAVIGIFGVNAAMILFGAVMEHVNVGRDKVTWLPFVCGCVAGAVPWIAITLAVVRSSLNGPANAVPPFVYAIIVTEFLFFNCFAVNQWLQYRGRERGTGRFADYLYGEKVYLVLSLVAKSALAWQVFGGTLAS